MSVTEADTRKAADRLPTGLLDRIVAHLSPRRVILFGSQATGNTHRDSDWDLLIVVDDAISSERINWRAIYEVRRGIRGAIDLIPCRESTFQQKRGVIGSLPWIVDQEGVVVYERPEYA